LKKLLLISVLSTLAVNALAQAVSKGDIILTANIGAPHLFKGIVKVATGSNAFKNNFDGKLEVSSIKGLNPIAVKAEYGFHKRFTLGLNYATWNLKFDVTDYYNIQNQSAGNILQDSVDVYNIKLKSTSFGLRPVFHFAGKSTRNDWYIGLGLGITKNTVAVDFSSTDIGRTLGPLADRLKKDLSLPGGVYFAPSLGYRRYLNNYIALNFELGYEKGAIVQAGLSAKIPTAKKEAAPKY